MSFEAPAAPAPYRVVDLFAGGGGASLGIHQALGCSPLFALNHDPAAIEMHRENHPHTEHAISDVFEIDPRKEEFAYLSDLDALWASPDCRHFSKAKGAALVSAKVRGLAWSTIAWLKAKQPRILFLENVEEFQTWGPIHRDPEHPEHGRPIQARKGETFRKFIAKLEALGYRAEWRTLNAADYGAPTARRRLFLIARRDGQTINWPKATHGPGLKPYHTAAECIDWSIPTSSIFGRKKPLADKTLARIAHGIVRHVIDDPAPYVAPIECQDVAAFFTPRYGERPTQAPRSRDIRRPMPTVVGTGNGASLVSVMLSKHYGGVVGNRLDQPLGTITSSDSQGPTAARLEQVEPNEQTDRVAAFLVKYYGTGHGQTLKAPLHTVTTKGRFAMVTARIDGETYAITDIGMRMLQPRELAKAQGFPESYHLIGTQAQQIAKLGNSVPPPVARALVASNVPARPNPNTFQA
jgi:DNA (cytosine-5)-methyltransferase 1